MPPALAPRRIVKQRVPIKLAAAETGHAFSLTELRTPPGTSAPVTVLHFEEKTFYVLDGSYVFHLGDEKVVLGAGDLAFVPRGTPHSYRNARPMPARMLVLATPGGNHERLLAAIGATGVVPTDSASAGPPVLATIGGAVPASPVAFRVREGATPDDEVGTPVRRNGRGFGPPSAFYRQRYPVGGVRPRPDLLAVLDGHEQATGRDR
jgi:mannose-6-phosphate isomerase-like protein (cupin superfamily)